MPLSLWLRFTEVSQIQKLQDAPDSTSAARPPARRVQDDRDALADADAATSAGVGVCRCPSPLGLRRGQAPTLSPQAGRGRRAPVV